MKLDEMSKIRERLKERRQRYRRDLRSELNRLRKEASAIGIERIILFGSFLRGEAGLSSDLDLLMVWDTPLDYLSRTVELYRRLKPRVAVDMLVYTPEEMKYMTDTPLVRKALAEGELIYEA